MRKVILVDDERLARLGLVGMIPWEEYGYEVVGEAEDGEDALTLIERTEPDVVITDIRMPVIDGLELIQAVRARGGKEIGFIIISGHGDFKYAQQAVRFGVQDYLLKPIDEKELVDALIRIRKQLEKERSSLEAGEALLHASLFENLLSGRAEEDSIRAASAAFGLPEHATLRYMAVELNDMPLSASDAERIELSEKAKRAISKALARSSQFTEPYIHRRGEHELGVLVPDAAAGLEARRIGEELERACAGLGSVVPKIYIGEAVIGLRQIRQSYLSIADGIKRKYALDDRNVLLHEEMKGIELNYREIDNDLYDELIERLEEQKIDAMMETVEKMLRAFREQGMSAESIRAAISRCVHEASRILTNMHGDSTKLATLKPLLEWAEQPRTLRGIRELLLGFLTDCAEYVTELRGAIGKGDIGKIKAYIESHYCENINLKSIAKRYYMNPVYLGQLFKKTYGSYFNEFLLQLRIREAKRQLRQTDKKVYEIAASVGFGNPDYFVSQFEKVEGKSPTEYKNAMLGNV
ncbi:response regulator transcription factor [Cohnella sp. AR92]|uniref:response regulator transcription factor n=1 Tax=Cohnella sp. AR92 TaxID=648716 RepID=UPI000F8F0726|nr:response regulator transcription factor [Cohnella sp. AR92]RUS47914.1 response regulator transcription factor [Cohnella sp. AR92]